MPHHLEAQLESQRRLAEQAQYEAAAAKADRDYQVAVAERTNIQTQRDATNFAIENLQAKENVIHEMIKDARASEDLDKAYDLERELRQVESTKMQVNGALSQLDQQLSQPAADGRAGNGLDEAVAKLAEWPSNPACPLHRNREQRFAK